MHEIQVGSSSRDIRLQRTIQFTNVEETSFMSRESYPPMSKNRDQSATVADDVFAQRFGPQQYHSVLDTISEERKKTMVLDYHKKQPIDRNTLLKDAASSSILAKVLLFVTLKVAAKEIKRGPARKRHLRMLRANVENLPLRNLVLFSQGGISFRLLDSLIYIMNGKYGKAVRKLVKRRTRDEQTTLLEETQFDVLNS
jgi:hypothetical protein